MANLSFLYSVDKIPTKDNRKEVNKEELSVSSWYIPFSFLVLISGNPQPVGSLIWETEKKFAIVGDYQEGVKNLALLFNLISSSKMLNSRTYLDSVVKTLEFLNLEKNKQKYILLEPAEIFGLVDEVCEKEVLKIINRSLELKKAIANGALDKVNAIAWEHALSTRLGLLGITSWSDPTYSFGPSLFFQESLEGKIKRYAIETYRKIAVNEVMLSKNTKANFNEIQNRFSKFGNYRFNVQLLINIIQKNLDSTGEFYSQDIPDLYAKAVVCKYALSQKNPMEILKELSSEKELTESTIKMLNEVVIEMGGPEMNSGEYKRAAQSVLKHVSR